MNNNQRKSLAAAILAGAIVSVLPSFTLAQGQIDTSRGNEANNRIGSGGRNYNTNYVNPNQLYTGNNGNRVVTGNVTLGREFRDNVGYSDPSSFRGNTAGSISDNFIKNSAGVPQPYAPAPVPNQSTTFYGAANTVQAPPGYQLSSNPNQPKYIAPTNSNDPRGPQDARLGIVNLNQPLSPVNAPGDMITRGGTTPQSILTGSTLYGVREWNPQDPADRMFIENLINRQNNTFHRMQLDPREIQKMREELQKALGNEPTDASVNQKPLDAVNPNQLSKPFDAPAGSALENKPLNNSVQADPLGAGLETSQGTRNYLLGARKTSTQYAELNKRLEQYYADRKKTDADFAREFNDEVRAKAAADAKAKAIAAAKNPTDPNPVKPNPEKPAVEDPTKPKVKKPAPVKINTLAAGVKAEGLANLLKKAESLMKEGKFASALDQYDAAEAVTPNNPLVWLGRANAELGAGFYVRADNHIRQAVMTDKSLLMGQYDLTAMLGEDRLGKIVTELKEQANKDTKPLPLFLLAYIAYNTGHERQAMGYLDLAEKRTPDKDLVFKMIREHWTTPEETTPDKPATPEKPATPDTPKPELNK